MYIFHENVSHLLPPPSSSFPYFTPLALPR
jgi:hypothetical protein